MSLRTQVIAVFDIGKTNKKVFLWNTSFEIVFEKQIQFAEILDADHVACEDLAAVQQWIVSTFTELCQMPEFDLIGLTRRNIHCCYDFYFPNKYKLHLLFLHQEITNCYH